MLRHHLVRLCHRIALRTLTAISHTGRALKRHAQRWRLRNYWPQVRQRWMQAGYSLPELLIALAIGMLLLSQALPQFKLLIRDTKLSTGVNQFIAAQEFARAEAIQRGRPVTICRSAHADQGVDRCTEDLVDGHQGRDWAAGWLVFVESSGGELGQVDAEDEILQRQGTLYLGGEGDATHASFIWGPQGTPVNIAGARVQFSWEGKQQRVLCFSRAGRIRVLRDVDRCS